ncbi:hypothetical protein [Powai lake megavirus]|uniref:Bro-N domain-containing protein n=1 Tax=Powai lake megavirus TaxID=1842663 RepID=A0A167RR51_9VIRU|nr:hypothetical protein QJ849_gp971 [Powai lake megavirus]ANB51133.1 hypothetical protein [Powai lake megavirus]
MNTLKDIKINGIKYYHADDLISLKLTQFKGCTNGRRLISNLNIDDNNYVFATNKSGKWIKTDGKSRKFDKVLIKVSWIKDNVSDEDDNDDSNNNSDNEDNLENEIVMAPGIIKLNKIEKIKDDKKKIVDIEVRGTRDPRNCFFKASDVSKGFGMKNLSDTINRSSGYKLGIHYRYFYLQKNTDPIRENNKIKNNKKIKKLYLTYEGLLRVMFVSKNDRVSRFIMWATNTLFTAHLGTQDQKNMLCSKLMGITTDIVKEVFNKTSSTLPTLYLFTIGKVKDLRVTLDIGEEYDDECIVAKGGETIDLTRRIDEHTESYGKMPGAKLLLKCYNYIDPQYTSKAETDLFQVLKKMNYIFKHPKYKEIIIYTKKESDLITKEFGKIARDYTGHIKEISDKLKCFENQHNIMKLEYEKEITNKEKDIMQLEKENSDLKYQNEIIELKYKNKLLEKDRKIAKLEKNIKNMSK